MRHFDKQIAGKERHSRKVNKKSSGEDHCYSSSKVESSVPVNQGLDSSSGGDGDHFWRIRGLTIGEWSSGAADLGGPMMNPIGSGGA
ncbi:e3 ubiquitin/ISG15 ligase TRIM25-like protein [Corchorus capsularis]|uniref:E3 ubiquitin/ISG15 ligase TRIM25-like protein n=1 Tax=Corchorus capsularis TaxID=210143 RepID=A0A1R3FWE4_COCAP|nr:e3 ubiquitin/ISG15 ligase TRIM25-like protein [Corchorus capsularis]